MTYVAVDPATCPKCEDAEFLLVEHHQHPESVAARLQYIDVESLRRHLRGHHRRDLLEVISSWVAESTVPCFSFRRRSRGRRTSDA